MEQPRVFEFAKEIGMETLALMDKIREWKLPVKSHMAALDPSLMDEIRNRLSAEKTPAQVKTKKKAVVAKAGAKASAKGAAPPKEAIKKPAQKAAGKVATVKSAAKATATKIAPQAAASTKPTAMARVIRRKASDIEAKSEAEAELLRLATESSVQEIEVQDAQVADIEPQEAAVSAEPREPSAAPGVSEGDRPKPRRNIVGRMDLNRVSEMNKSSSPTPNPSASGPAGTTSRPSRTAPRNIRTGFVAPMPMEITPDRTAEQDDHRFKEEKALKKKAGAHKEEEVIHFTATEFRKREVVFQPKKKKVLLGREAKKTQITTPKASKRVVKVHGSASVAELANQMQVKVPVLITKLMKDGVVATPMTVLDFDTISLVAPEFGFEAQNVYKTAEQRVQFASFGELDAEKQTRPAVVTVMGHVDHGKTTLLDTIRKATVARGEAGGITQHIGAYSVRLEDGSFITFIDTPGHEAFTAMRARGAHVTDVAVIVVAADDGLMPQTAEAINHAKAAQVPIIVAVNKMDKPNVNPDRIKQQLTEFELVPEEWGGETIYAPVSALKGTGVPELLEQIRIVAEMRELRANPKRSATGVVIESRVEKGRGSVATLLVQDGTLEVGQPIVAGMVPGRVRSMMNDRGEMVKTVAPGFPVEVMGLENPPNAGDRFDVCIDEDTARTIAEQRRLEATKLEVRSPKVSLEELFSKVKSGDVKELPIILKSDVAGSLEAIRGVFDKIESTEVKIRIVHAAVGAISESDVLLASTTGGMVIGFNVRPDTSSQRLAKEKGVEIKTYSIIYELSDDVKKAMSGLLTPEVVEKVMGRAEVRNTFTIPKIGTIAGSFVKDGKIARNHRLRLLRDGKIIYEGAVSSLKRFKDDVKEVQSGYECGIGIENFNDIKNGDEIEAFVQESIAREL